MAIYLHQVLIECIAFPSGNSKSAQISFKASLQSLAKRDSGQCVHDASGENAQEKFRNANG